jgi:MoaA/NifB/PqqE/SkfB family radical SAM enzyme
MKRERGFMSENNFKKVIDECAEHGTPVRFIRLGEPFLHPKIIDFIKYVKSKGLPLHITNNGLAIKKEQIKSLIELQVDSITFSFQGATKAEYEIMRCNRRYGQLKANIIEMARLRGKRDKPFIHISSTMTDETEKEIKKFVDYWKKIADSVGTGKTNLSQFTVGQIKSFENLDKLEFLRKQETVKKAYRPCTEVYQKLSVDWDGKVTCCCGDFDNFLEVGDLSKASLSGIWNSSKRLKLIREMLDKNMHKTLTFCSTCYHPYEKF